MLVVYCDLSVARRARALTVPFLCLRCDVSLIGAINRQKKQTLVLRLVTPHTVEEKVALVAVNVLLCRDVMWCCVIVLVP